LPNCDWVSHSLSDWMTDWLTHAQTDWLALQLINLSTLLNKKPVN
jgi:hypothetical protein